MQRSQEKAMPEHVVESQAITISAPRTTRVTALIVMAGVLAQAALAGGFLAGMADWRRFT